MAIKDKLTEEYLQAQQEIEAILLDMLFQRHSFIEIGFAYFIQYKKDDTIIEFIFGPPEFQIEMIIFISERKYAFRDLLQIPIISEWVNTNRYVQRNNRNVKDELLWFLKLMKFSMPVLQKI